MYLYLYNLEYKDKNEVDKFKIIKHFVINKIVQDRNVLKINYFCVKYTFN